MENRLDLRCEYRSRIVIHERERERVRGGGGRMRKEGRKVGKGREKEREGGRERSGGRGRGRGRERGGEEATDMMVTWVIVRAVPRDDSCPTEIVWYWHVARKVTNAHTNDQIRCSKYRNSERIAGSGQLWPLCLLQRWIIPSNHCRATTKHPVSLGFCSICCFPRVSISHSFFVVLSLVVSPLLLFPLYYQTITSFEKRWKAQTNRRVVSIIRD